MSLDMNLYKNRLQAYKVGEKEGQIDIIKRKIASTFKTNPSYELVKINGLECGVHIVDENFLNNSNLFRKRLLCHPDNYLNFGDLIEWNSNRWLCVNIDPEHNIQYIGIIQKCNQTFKWQDSNHNIHEYPVVLSDKTSVYSDGLETGRFITLTDDQILITIPNTPHTKQLKIDKRIMFNNDIDNVYKITKIQDLVHEGLIYITMSRGEYNSANDNVELGICDYVEVTPPQEPIPIGYSIVVNGDNTINRSGSKTYNAKVYADGEEVFDKTVVWILNNSNASITSSTGLSCIVKGLVIGNVVLKAELSDDTSVFGEKTIQITGLF